MKKIIRLTESDIHRIVKQSVNKILKESWSDDLCRKLKGTPGTVDNPYPQGKSESDLPNFDELTPEEKEFVMQGVNGMGKLYRMHIVKDARRKGIPLGEYLKK